MNKSERARATSESFPVDKELFGTYALVALIALLAAFILQVAVFRKLP